MTNGKTPIQPPAGFENKLFRAEQHLQELESQMWLFLKGNAHSITYHIEAQSTKHSYRVQVNKTTPDNWPLKVGDILHNMRSALDHLAWRLAGFPATTPPNGTEFPIFEDRDLFFLRTKKGRPDGRSGLHKIRGMTSTVQAIIEGLQPFQDGPRAKNHHLWVLHALSNTDKHRVLNLVSAVHQHTILEAIGRFDNQGIFHEATFDGSFRDNINFGPFEDGAVLAEFTFGNPQPDLYVNCKFAIDIAFRDGTASRYSVSGTLRGILNYIRTEVFRRLTRVVP